MAKTSKRQANLFYEAKVPGTREETGRELRESSNSIHHEGTEARRKATNEQSLVYYSYLFFVPLCLCG
jgi:hypothetical protein